MDRYRLFYFFPHLHRDFRYLIFIIDEYNTPKKCGALD